MDEDRDYDLEENYEAIKWLLNAGTEFQRKLREGPLKVVEIEAPEPEPGSLTRH